MFVAESKRLTHQGAKKIMATAVELASQAKIAISCAIVDAGGHVILIERMDGGHAIGLALAAGPERWTAMEGGVPVLVDRECIGGVGVSGGDWETDLRIARMAVESIGADWE
jgi:glc operon protein GlcG